jgi:hypothetical protein
MRAAIPPVPSAVNPALTPHLATGGCPHCGGRPRRKRTRRPTEATDFAQMVARMLRAHGRRVADADTEDLADLIALREVLEEAIAYAVGESRARHGRSWADIARAANSTKQAAQQRWGQR